MARQKRTSASVKFAQTRLAALTSISDPLDLGNGKTSAAYAAKIKTANDANDVYNTQLSVLDGMLDDAEAADKLLDAESVVMLAAVAVKFGKDSAEYEKAGGTRTSERKRPVRKPKTP